MSCKPSLGYATQLVIFFVNVNATTYLQAANICGHLDIHPILTSSSWYSRLQPVED